MTNLAELYKGYFDYPRKEVNKIDIDDLYDDTELYLYDTSYDNPFTYSGIHENLFHINREFYENNKDEVKKIILNTIKNTKEDNFYLSNKEFIDKEIICALISNKNIKNLTFEGDIYLNKDIIQYILSSHISHLYCNVNFDEEPELLYQYIPGLDIINYPEVAGTSVLKFGNQNVELFIHKSLTEKELTQLKILFTLYPQEKTYINAKYKKQLDTIINLINSNKIIIRRFVPYTKQEYIALSEKYDNVYFSVASSYVTTIENLILREDIMDSIIEEVNRFELSPLEKYMYLYNIVKMYKEYKEVEEDNNPYLSRYSEYTLFNDYMVCVGFAELLEELVDRLKNKNVVCSTYSCSIVDDNDKESGHCRCLIKIKDEKYDIDGIYIADPTWDSIKYFKREKNKKGITRINYKVPTANIDLYNHIILTKEEVMDELVSYGSKDASDALFHNNDSITSLNDWSTISFDIDKINKKFHTNILINKINDKRSTDIIKSNPVSGSTLITAITNLYSIIYRDSSNVEDLVRTTVQHNILYQHKYFNKSKEKFGVKTKIKK